MCDLLAGRFSDVGVVAYWSAEAGWAPTPGCRAGRVNTFGVAG